MKTMLRKITIIASVWYAPAAHATQQWITVINDLGISTPVTVTVSQINLKDPKNTEKFFKKSSKKLYYLSTAGEVTVEARATIGKQTVTKERIFDDIGLLQKNQIHIQKDAENSIKLELEPKKIVVPKKQKIRAFKTVFHDEDWTVRIEDNEGNKISESTFKRNTDRFAKSLYVQLSNNPDLKQYSKNIIKIYESKNSRSHPSQETPIQAGVYQIPNSEIEITDTSTKVVPKGMASSGSPMTYTHTDVSGSKQEFREGPGPVEGSIR